ncbi:MAG: M42 family metallopeptidase [Bacilli bacterium]|nr:M42 family metallopeptidase [Bacilli bacterium]
MNELKILSELNGISGHEKAVREYLTEQFSQIVSLDSVSYDNLGSVIVKKGNKGPKIALAGHMDEIGMIITRITDDGYMRFQTVGGWWGQVMLAQQMTITTQEGKTIRAIMGSKPPHILSAEERKNPVKIEDMYLDIGVTTKDEAEALGIRIGDMVTPAIPFQVMANGDFLLGKAWDNRIGCAIILETLRRLQIVPHPNVIYGIGTVQEEVGLRGAKTAANIIEPDISIALDVGIAKDTPGTDGSVKMGKGPQIMLVDGGLVGHVGLRSFFLEVAKKHDIPIQLDYLTGGATDAGAMHLASAGSPAISLCIPSRYIHSHTSVISYQDFKHCVDLLVNVLQELDEERVKTITYFS